MKGSTEQAGMLRYGKVEIYDPERHMAKVYFPDLDIVSYWLPIVIPNSLMNHDELHVDKEEHVACLMTGNGTERGIILGAIYDDKNKPIVKDKDKRSVTFSDGTQIIYDRKEHLLTVHCVKDIQTDADKDITEHAKNIITIKADAKVRVEAPTVEIEGSLIHLIGGHIDLDGSVTCPGYCRC